MGTGSIVTLSVVHGEYAEIERACSAKVFLMADLRSSLPEWWVARRYILIKADRIAEKPSVLQKEGWPSIQTRKLFAVRHAQFNLTRTSLAGNQPWPIACYNAFKGQSSGLVQPTSIIRTSIIRILDYPNMFKFNDCTSTHAQVGVAGQGLLGVWRKVNQGAQHFYKLP